MSEDCRERIVFRPTSDEVRILDAGDLPKQVWLQLDRYIKRHLQSDNCAVPNKQSGPDYFEFHDRT